MSIEHTARTGTTYYLHVLPGKASKLNYHFSTNPDGPLAQSVPSGFEIYENIRGQVFLRRQSPQLVTDQEIARVRDALNRRAEEWRYKIELRKNAITIYEAEDRSEMLEAIALPWISKATIKQSAIRSANYTAVMRFLLTDREKRLFRAERFCFRGSVDDWIDIGGSPQKLPAVIKKFIRHL